MVTRITRFCVVTTARSGSTWLATLLNSHPAIKSLEEPFIWRADRPYWNEKLPTFYDYAKSEDGQARFSVFRYIDLMSELYLSGRVEVLGFKVMYNHIKRHPSILLKLVADRFKIIHLVRTNYLDILISRTAANQYSILHSTQEGFEEKRDKRQRVTLDVDSLASSLVRYRRNARIIRTALNLLPLPVLEISYEELLSDRERVLQRVSRFLNVSFDSASLHSELKRLHVGSYSEKIENYTEVKKMLAGTQFDYLIDK